MFTTSTIQYIYGIIDVIWACIFHSVDAVNVRFVKGTMSKHGLTIRRKCNQKCIDN